MLEFLHPTRSHARTATPTTTPPPATPRDAEADQAIEEGRTDHLDHEVPSALMALMAYYGGIPGNPFMLPAGGARRPPRARRCRPRD